MKSKWLFVLFILAYFIPSFSFDFVFESWQQGLTPYYYELGFVLVSIYIFRSKFSLKTKNKRMTHFLRYFCMGLLTLLFCKIFSTNLPFDLNSNMVKLSIVFIGPILEELVFRFAIWNAIEKITDCKKTPLHVTSILFGVAHFKAIFIITPPYITYITFQTLYTLILGYALGKRYEQNRNVLEVILLHILFNLGFLLAYVGLY
jgi:membrane protease YdiL (CAAX protease family)